MEQENEKRRLQDAVELRDEQEQLDTIGMSDDAEVDDVDISAELRSLGEQTYESGKRILGEVKRRANAKSAELSDLFPSERLPTCPAGH